MERIPIISTAREELAEAVSSGPVSPPSPIACSPWVAMSTLQKAIRRGVEDLALRAAATLLRDTPERLWRRSGIIAFEDRETRRRVAGRQRDRLSDGARALSEQFFGTSLAVVASGHE